MIFHFVKIMDDLELFKGKAPKIRFGDVIFFGNSSNMIQKIWGAKRSRKCRNFGIPES